MTRIYEALKQVEADRTSYGSVIDFPGTAKVGYSNDVQLKMRELYRSIVRHLPGNRGKVIQFLGPRGGIGASRSLRAFARVCAENLNLSVLVVDTEKGSPQFSHYSINPIDTWTDAIQRDAGPESAFCKIPTIGLTLIKAFHDNQSASRLLDSPVFRAQLENLKSSFDLVLVDSPAADVSVDGLELSAIVDASILVVEAEKTRWQVAQSAKEKLENRGGRVLGVLLNGLPFHIPDSIYGRL
jgi:Mrp family chromosome partitioning ATPase